MEDDFGSSSESFTFVLHYSESTSSIGFPSVLVIIIGFGNDSDSLSNQVGGIETDSELTNHRNISSSRNCFHESFGSWLGNGSQIVDKLSLGHTNTGILNSESVVAFVWNDLDS